MTKKESEVKGKWSYEGKKYIVSYTKREPRKNEVILSPEELMKRIAEHDRQLLTSIKKGEIRKDKLHILNSTRSNLKRGEIVGTKEAVIRKFQNIEEHFKNIKRTKYEVLDNIYMSSIESAQAFLLKKGLQVVSPRDVPNELKKSRFSERKKVEEIAKAFKDYEHGKTKIPAGKKIDSLKKKAKTLLESAKNE